MNGEEKKDFFFCLLILFWLLVLECVKCSRTYLSLCVFVPEFRTLEAPPPPPPPFPPPPFFFFFFLTWKQKRTKHGLTNSLDFPKCYIPLCDLPNTVQTLQPHKTKKTPVVGAVNTQGFVWKFFTRYIWIFIHSFIQDCAPIYKSTREFFSARQMSHEHSDNDLNRLR